MEYMKRVSDDPDGSPGYHLGHFSITRQPDTANLVHLDTDPINIQYLDLKNCGALYIKSVTNDMVHPETI